MWCTSVFAFCLWSGRWQGVRRVVFANNFEDVADIAPAVLFLSGDGWNHLQILVSSTTFAPSARVYGALSCLTENLLKPSRGCGNTPHSELEAATFQCLKCWLRYLWEQRGAVQPSGQSFAWTNNVYEESFAHDLSPGWSSWMQVLSTCPVLLFWRGRLWAHNSSSSRDSSVTWAAVRALWSSNSRSACVCRYSLFLVKSAG